MKREGPAPSRVTSADVARAAGVSRATVSYVLNEVSDQQISQATRQRVRDAASRLGYAPHAGARSLRRGRSDLVVVAVPAWVPLGPGLSALLHDLAEALTARGLVCATDIGRTDAGEDTARDWLRLNPLAVVMLGLAANTSAAGVLRTGGVHLLDPFGASEADTFGAFQRSVGRTQGAYLIGRGHRRLGYADTTAPALAPMAGHRLAGLRQACRDAGLPDPVVRKVPLSASAAADAVRGWTSEPVSAPGARPVGSGTATDRVSAVAAYNDETAITTASALVGLGVRVPDEVAVMGVDDIPMASALTPALTTVRWPTRWFGTTVAALVAALQGEAPGDRPVPIPRPPDFALQTVVRDSA